jgi:hypothetical protein
MEQWRAFGYLNRSTRKIKVVRCVWKSVNTDGYDVRQKRDYNKLTKLKNYTDDIDKGKKHSKSTIRYEVVYEGYLIMGSDIVFGFDLVKDMTRTKRDYKSLTRTEFPIKTIRTAVEKSIVRRMIPLADEIQMAWLKTQQIMQKVKPPGLGVNEERVIANISNRESPKQAFFDALDIYESNGVFKFGGNGSGDALPFIPIPNQVVNELIGLFNVLTSQYEMMKQIAGLNEYTDASSPNSKALVGLGQMAAAGTNNAIGRVYDSARELVARLCIGIMARINVIAENYGLEKYDGAIGIQNRLVLEASAKEGLHDLGITIDSNPDETFMQLFMEELRTQRGLYESSRGSLGIPPDVYMTILRTLHNGQSYREAELLLRAAQRRVKKDNERMKQMDSQMAQEANMKATQVAQEQERMTLQIQTEMEAQLDTVRTQNEAQLVELRENYRLQGIAMQGENAVLLQDDRQAYESGENQRKASIDFAKAAEERRLRMSEIAAKREAALAKIMADRASAQEANQTKQLAKKE